MAFWWFTFVVLMLVCLFVLDDFFIDIVSWLKVLKPEKLTPEKETKLLALPEKSIAIIVANWKEAEVIGRMVAGNNKRVLYSRHQFFLGVYPNDLETLTVAREAAALHSNVHVVVNSLRGPTSKGQMLNEIVRGIFEEEKKTGHAFDVFLMQDSEDMLHPLLLKVINREIEDAEFLQTPVFSMDRPVKQLIGGTYIEEFAELHTKDLFVREALGAAIPSAGVGTAIARPLMLKLTNNPARDFLREECLTEDYVLGLGARAAKFKCAFCCFYREDENGRRDYIATREYFPAHFRAAIRQKSRWVIGIVFQGTRLVPWSGSFWNRYFLYRDRRGPLNSLVAMACTALTLYLVARWVIDGAMPEIMREDWFILGSTIALAGAFNRIGHRVLCVIRVNGYRRAWAVVIRWPFGNLVNCCASLRAMKQYGRHLITGEPLKWVKTTHELPENFG